MIRKTLLLGALTGAGVLLVAPGAASAATTLGATFEPNSCGKDTTYIQTVSPGNAYTVPFNGVITSWSYQAGATNVPNVARLKVARVAPGTDLTTNATISIVGESTVHAPIASTLNTYPTQIPVQAGDLIGEYLDGTTPLVGCSRQDDAYTDHYFDGADVSPGMSDTFTEENFQQDISATVEGDCDIDGLGDETQDTDTATCHPAVAQPVVKKKKKCKKHKKKHRSAESAKKKKCKKKKRR